MEPEVITLAARRLAIHRRTGGKAGLRGLRRGVAAGSRLRLTLHQRPREREARCEHVLEVGDVHCG